MIYYKAEHSTVEKEEPEFLKCSQFSLLFLLLPPLTPAFVVLVWHPMSSYSN